MSYIHLSSEHLVTKHTPSSRISFNGANFQPIIILGCHYIPDVQWLGGDAHTPGLGPTTRRTAFFDTTELFSATRHTSQNGIC